MPAIATTIVSVPLATHLREGESLVNNGPALHAVIGQATAMAAHLLAPLLALSGRFPQALKVPDPDFLERLRTARQLAGLPAAEVGVKPHWLWQYLTDGLDTGVAVVERATFLAVLGERGAEIREDPAAARRVTVRLTSGVEKAFVFAEDEGVQVLARDGRDATKAELWDAAAARGIRRRATAISVGDSAPYYMAGWILGVAAAPSSLTSADTAKAEALLPIIQSLFTAAADEAARWRQQAAAALGKGPGEARVTARVRAALASCCYEVLKVTRSWVSLDRIAEVEKVTRHQAYEQALARLEPAASQDAVRHLLDAIQRRAEEHLVASADATPLHPGGLTWKAAAAIRSFMNGGALLYPREGAEHPWSHPDWQDFWDAFGSGASTRQALELVVTSIGAAGEEDTSIAEVYRTWYRAQGYARLSIPAVVRIHVDRSNSGTSGTLDSGVDATERTRARGQRAHQPVAVIDASVHWLGRDHALRFHQGRNRALALTQEKAAWGVVLERNIRTGHQLPGVCKAFDLSVRGDRVRIDLPIQVTLPSFEQVPLAKQLAIGGWYRSRPGGEPMSPGPTVTPPETATVLGLDIGVCPIAGFAVIRKEGDRFTDVASGQLGVIPDGQDPELFVPGFGLRAAGQAVAKAQALRRYLRLAQDAEPRDRALAQARARLAAHDDELAIAADRLVGAANGPSQLLMAVPQALIALLPAVARTAAGAVTKGHEVLIGSSRYAGAEIPAGDQVQLTSRVVQMAAGLLPAGDSELSQVVLALLRPLAGMLLAYQRLRVCRADLGTVSKKHGYGEAAMNVRRAAITARHGYQSESHYWSIAHLGATNAQKLERGTDGDHDRALTVRILLADLWESVSDLGRALAGWGRPSLKRGEAPAADDPRAVWDAAYGFLRTHAAAIRTSAHEGIAKRAVSLARVHGAALAIERLDLRFSGRVDADANTLARKMAASDWTTMLLRAADLGGIPVVQIDAWWTSREIAPMEDGALIPRRMGVRLGRDLHHLGGRAIPLPVRVNSARNLALRSLTGYPERVRFPVLLHQAGSGSIAVFARPAAGVRTWAAWQQRMARALGVQDPAQLAWEVSPGGRARLLPELVAPHGAGSRNSLVAQGAEAQGGLWLTAEAFWAAERQLIAQISKDAAG